MKRIHENKQAHLSHSWKSSNCSKRNENQTVKIKKKNRWFSPYSAFFARALCTRLKWKKNEENAGNTRPVPKERVKKWKQRITCIIIIIRFQFPPKKNVKWSRRKKTVITLVLEERFLSVFMPTIFIPVSCMNLCSDFGREIQRVKSLATTTGKKIKWVETRANTQKEANTRNAKYWDVLNYAHRCILMFGFV